MKNFVEIYHGMIEAKEEEKPNPIEEMNKESKDSLRRMWLENPLTIDLRQTLLTLTTGFMRYVVDGCGENEAKTKEAIHRMNTMLAIRGYIDDGEFQSLVNKLNLIER